MADIKEIAPDVFRISTYIPEADLTFNQFLVRDDEPLLFHTGMRGLFTAVHQAVAGLIEPDSLRWIGFSHFEADECGALREWQSIAPEATAVCSVVGKLVSVDDVVALRPARGLEDGEILITGKYRFRYVRTPHVPHGWDAGLLFEERHRTLFCSDLFYHKGAIEPQTTSDIVERARDSLLQDQATPYADPYPYTPNTAPTYKRLSAMEPATLATMHGSAFSGDGSQALEDYAEVLRELSEAA